MQSPTSFLAGRSSSPSSSWSSRSRSPTTLNTPQIRIDADSDPSCRILTVSSSLALGRGFVERFKAFSSTVSKGVGESTSTSAPASASPLIIPHVLSNKYYTAPVHFAVYASVKDALCSLSDDNAAAPAVVYVWSAKDGYKKDVEELGRAIKKAGWEPEVVLGVRLPCSSQDEEKDEKDNGQIDSELMESGFEYVDVDDSGEKDDLDVPGLPRVLDALSTIMWPSMESVEEEQEQMMRELLLGRDFESEQEPDSPEGLSPFGGEKLGRKVSMRFEDDFSEFISAPVGNARFTGLDLDLDLGDTETPLQTAIAESVGTGDSLRLWSPRDYEELGEEDFEEMGSTFDALQEMKREIAGMTDEEEKRRLAAKVALGLVYNI